MKGKALARRGVIRVLLFGATVTLVLCPASGWAQQSSVQADFLPLLEQRFDARSAPAKVTGEGDYALTSKGYVRIGTVRASQPGTERGAVETQILQAAILAKATEAGCDLVQLVKEAVVDSVSVPTGKTRRKCSQLVDMPVGVTTPIYENHCWTDPQGRYRCEQRNTGRVNTTYNKTCKTWVEEWVPEIVKGLVSEGAVWRYEPKMAAVELRKVAVLSLFEAAKAGDSAKTKALLEDDPTLAHAADQIGRTPLMQAAIFGHLETVELLLTAGVDVNAADKTSATALYWAACVGDKDLLERLLAAGANVNVQDAINNTPLFEAVICRKPEAVQLLLAKGADVNSKGFQGDCPLHLAAQAGHKEVVQILLANGANVSARNAKNKTPLGVAVEHNHKEIVDLLRQHGGQK